MFTDAIVKNSLLSSGKVFQSVGTCRLDGHITLAGQENTDHGLLYGSFVKDGNNYVFNLYKDITKSNLVASATTTTLPAVADFTEENSSGLSGYVYLLEYGADDTAITVQTLLSVDSDLPMSNMETFAEFDPIAGFAEFHQKAFNYITKEFLLSRIAGLLFNPDYKFLPDNSKDVEKVQQKGYDFGKLLNPQALREAAAWHALSRLCELHSIEPAFQVKAQEARNRVAAILHAVDLSIDENSTGQEKRRRSLNLWKVSR